MVRLGEDDGSLDAPRRMDKAVRAALGSRPPEPRTFGNEDDVEGRRVAGRDLKQQAVVPA